MWIVRLALRRPYTFVVMGLAIALGSRTLSEAQLYDYGIYRIRQQIAPIKFSVVPADAVWVVPATALIARAAGPQVVSVNGDGRVHFLGVELGRDLGQSVEIVAGLGGQERLVVSPPDGLKEGTRVAAQEMR